MRIRKPVANRFRRSSVAVATYVIHSDGTVTVLGFGPEIEQYRPTGAVLDSEVVL